MIKSNLNIIFSLLDKLLKLMHLDTGDTEIVLRKNFSLKKINTKIASTSSIIINQQIEIIIEVKSKSFLYNVSYNSIQ